MTLTLYHGTCSSKPIEKLDVAKEAQLKNGMRGHFVYATHRFDMASVYTIGWDNLLVMQPAFQNPDDPLVVISSLSAERMLEKQLDGRVYEVSSNGFERVTSCGVLLNEWVKNQPAAISAQNTVGFSNVSEVLGLGVQIFSPATVKDEKDVENLILNPVGARRPFHGVVAELYAKGHLVWLNQMTDIKPKLQDTAWIQPL